LICAEKNTLSQKFEKEDSLLGHVKRTPEKGTVKKMFKNIPEGKRSVGEPRNGWLDDVNNDLKKISVKGLQKKTVRDRDACKLILKKTTVLHEP
jgi:hypothetical protein